MIKKFWYRIKRIFQKRKIEKAEQPQLIKPLKLSGFYSNELAREALNIVLDRQLEEGKSICREYRRLKKEGLTSVEAKAKIKSNY